MFSHQQTIRCSARQAAHWRAVTVRLPLSESDRPLLVTKHNHKAEVHYMTKHYKPSNDDNRKGHWDCRGKDEVKHCGDIFYYYY